MPVSSSAKIARPCSAVSNIKLDVKYKGTECSLLLERGVCCLMIWDCSFFMIAKVSDLFFSKTAKFSFYNIPLIGVLLFINHRKACKCILKGSALFFISPFFLLFLQ